MSVTPRPLLGVLGALLLAVPCRAEDTVLEILTARNRPAESLVADLAPLAGPTGAVTASGSKLIVRATPAALARIKRVLAALDVTPRSLWIRVRQAGTSRDATQRAEVTGRVDTAGGRTRTVVSGAFARQDGTASDDTEQSLRAVEGMPALIRLGESRAAPLPGLVATPSGTAVVQGTTLQQAETGVYVLARLAGDNVTLELATSKEAFNDRGGVLSHRLLTTVSGRLGEWLVVGGLARRDASAGGGLAGGERHESAEEARILILVEEVR